MPLVPILPYIGAGILGFLGYAAAIWTAPAAEPGVKVNVNADGTPQSESVGGWVSLALVALATAIGITIVLRWGRR